MRGSFRRGKDAGEGKIRLRPRSRQQLAGVEDDGRGVTLWLSGWGGHGRLAELCAQWKGLRERLYPEGKTL